MAKLICSIEEYHKFIGPRIRNVIQAMTKGKKRELNHICQHCKKEKELEAAHIKGKARKKIIENILADYLIGKKGRLIEVDIKEVEETIVKAHRPIDKYFLFLCAECHIKYDNS